MVDKFYHPIDDAFAHAAALGRLIVHWSNLERILIHLLRYLMTSDYGKSLLVYQEFVSVKAKINLLKRLNHYHYHEKTLKNEINNLLNQALKLNTKRNTFIHSFWGEMQHVHHLSRQKSISPSDHKIFENPIESFSVQDIQSVVEEIATLAQSLFVILNRVFGWKPKQP